MPVVIDATPAGISANSYATLAEADTYHEERLHTETWDAADDATKNIARVMATRLLDSMFVWAEWPTTEEQSLQWPRQGVLAANQLENIGDYEIPIELKRATAEFARQLIDSDSTENSDIEALGITSLSAGPVSLAFKATQTVKVVPDAVGYLMPQWWFKIRSRKTGIRELLRA